jgi:Phospholipase_D-nuclease N-terminal
MDGSSRDGYDDGRVACTDRDILVRRYYLRRDRRIDYHQITEARRVQLSARGKRRRHGGDFEYNFNDDPRRRGKDQALILYLGEQVKPVITPDDADRVAAELAVHGVRITSAHGDEGGFFWSTGPGGRRPLIQSVMSEGTSAARWFASLPPRYRVLLGAAAVAEIGLAAAAWTDIKRRPADQINGSKILWAGLSFVNFVGPLSYFAFGRRRRPDRVPG